MGWCSLEIHEGVALSDISAGKPTVSEVIADTLYRLGFFFDESCDRRAAAQGLDAEGAGAGVEVEDPCAGHNLG